MEIHRRYVDNIVFSLFIFAFVAVFQAPLFPRAAGAQHQSKPTTEAEGRPRKRSEKGGDER